MEGNEGEGKDMTAAPAPGELPKWFDASGGSEEAVAEPPAEGAEAQGKPDPFLLQLEDELPEQEGEEDALNRDHFLPMPAPRTDRRAPEWAKIPQGMRFPRGIEVHFVRIRAELTHARHKGDRQLIVWGLTDADEKLALQRAMADGNRAGTELAKQMVRAIDGLEVDWMNPSAPGSIDALWREIGGKGRGQLMRLYSQLHVYDKKEQEDFFANCVVSVATG